MIFVFSMTTASRNHPRRLKHDDSISSDVCKKSKQKNEKKLKNQKNSRLIRRTIRDDSIEIRKRRAEHTDAMVVINNVRA